MARQFHLATFNLTEFSHSCLEQLADANGMKKSTYIRFLLEKEWIATLKKDNKQIDKLLHDAQQDETQLVA